jgi:opine dehydrogenase
MEKKMAITKNDIWTVVGSGMGGKGLLAELGVNGFRLRAHDKNEAQIAGMRSAGGLHVEGREKNFAPIELATTDLAQAIDGARVILVSTYGTDTPQVARDLARHLKDGQLIIIVQGHFAGTLAFQKALADANCRAKVDVAEFDNYPYMMAVRAPNRVFMDTYKNYYQLGCRPAARAKDIVKEIDFAFPQVVAASNLLEAGFADVSALFHVAGLMTNVGRAEAGSPYNFFVPYNFYASNMTPGTCNLIEAMDRERVAVAKAYGIETPDVFKWLEDVYDRRDKTLADRLQANAPTHYRDSPAPNSLKHRFLSGDVPYTLVPISSLGEVAGVRTPVIDGVVTVSSALTQRDFRSEGRNLRNLGIEAKTVNEVIKAVTS